MVQCWVVYISGFGMARTQNGHLWYGTFARVRVCMFHNNFSIFWVVQYVKVSFDKHCTIWFSTMQFGTIWHGVFRFGIEGISMWCFRQASLEYVQYNSWFSWCATLCFGLVQYGDLVKYKWRLTYTLQTISLTDWEHGTPPKITVSDFNLLALFVYQV